MKPKRIILTGGPGTGKTTLINSLKQKGFFCFDEISREVIRAFQNKGISNPFESHQKEFSQLLFEGRLQQFKAIEHKTLETIFYDRALHDVIAYMAYANQSIPKEFKTIAEQHNYDLLFICPPWEAIYNTDNERFESFDQALKIHYALIKTYTQYGYNPIEIPIGSITSRINFIINTI